MSKFTEAGGAAYSSKKDDWETPRTLFEQLDEEFGFTLDAASSHANAKCEKHYTKEDDGLRKDWGGETVFCNPPYGRDVWMWAQKAEEESRKPGTTVVLLVAARTDTRWFHDHIYGKAEIRFLRGRLKFEADGVPGNPAPFPSMIAIFGEGGTK